MGRINYRQLRKELKPAMKTLGPVTYRAALIRFNRVKREELEEFRENDVSTEIDEGNQATHRVGILEEGNLFSFLGFPEGEQPARDLARKLDKHITLSKDFKTINNGDSIVFSFPINIPSQEEIEAATPSPAIPSRSWVAEIEKGISGLAKYVYYEFFRGGRSKTGLQARKSGGSQRATPVPYVSKFIKQLISRF